MTRSHPYLTFAGNCREAISFYHSCFGGDLNLQIVADSPMSAQMPQEFSNAIIHSTLSKGDLVVMASDNLEHNPVPLTAGTMITLHVEVDSEEEARSYFTKLAEGGSISMPLEEQFWGTLFGQVKDKYGIRWSIDYDQKRQQGQAAQ